MSLEYIQRKEKKKMLVYFIYRIATVNGKKSLEAFKREILFSRKYLLSLFLFY